MQLSHLIDYYHKQWWQGCHQPGLQRDLTQMEGQGTAPVLPQLVIQSSLDDLANQSEETAGGGTWDRTSKQRREASIWRQLTRQEQWGTTRCCWRDFSSKEAGSGAHSSERSPLETFQERRFLLTSIKWVKSAKISSKWFVHLLSVSIFLSSAANDFRASSKLHSSVICRSMAAKFQGLNFKMCKTAFLNLLCSLQNNLILETI